MTRAEAVAYLAAELRTSAAVLGVTATDDAAGYGNPIDRALRAMGVAEDDLASATVSEHIAAFQALALYYAVIRLERLAASLVDISVRDVGISKSRSQMFKQLATIKAQALDDATAEGFPPPGSGMTVLVGTVTYRPDPYAATVIE